ncbi:MAG: glycosyltransferase, partial [Chloroflexota bacterium]
VQAMACGLPVIATRSGGPETIIDDRRTGILVEPGDPRALADAIRYLAAEPARRVRLGEAARETVARRFSLEATIDAYQQLYRGRVGNPVEEAIPVR